MSRRCAVCQTAYAGTERFCPLDGGAIVDEPSAKDGRHVGETIENRYLVRKLLGRGGMGEVYEADHIGLDKRVAIKFVTSDNANLNAIARFRREARVASKIVHENVVHIYDVGRANEIDYIVMEYVEGKDLRDVLIADGRMMPARAVAITQQLLAGLGHVHDAGILHRDIKPANVLLTTRGNDRDFVKLMDFGISKAAGDIGEDAQNLTGTGNVVGTADYIAPEVLRGKPADLRADLYAVGITLWQMLVGKTPTDKLSFEQVIAKHLTERPARVDKLRTDVSPALADVVERALAKNPDERFANATEFRAALDRAMEGRRNDRTDENPRDGAADKTDEDPIVVPMTAEMRPSRVARPERRDDVEHPDARRTGPKPRPLWIYAIGVIAILAGAIIGIVVVTRSDDNKPVVAAIADAAPDASPLTALLDVARANRFTNRDASIKAYEDAFALDPTSTEVAYALADAYDEAGRVADALVYYKKYVELAPDASNRAKVDARIAALSIDAGVIADASEAPVTEPDKDMFGRTRLRDAGLAIDADPATAKYCLCLPADDAPNRDSLCPRLAPTSCRCTVGARSLCPDVPSGTTCPTIEQPGKAQGDACAGYPLEPSPRQTPGTYSCTICADADLREFRGEDGDRCGGYAVDGRPYVGKLSGCRTSRNL